MWEHCGISRNKESLEEGLRKIPALREEFWRDLKLPGDPAELNQSLEHAGRVLDFSTLGN